MRGVWEKRNSSGSGRPILPETRMDMKCKKIKFPDIICTEQKFVIIYEKFIKFSKISKIQMSFSEKRIAY